MAAEINRALVKFLKAFGSVLVDRSHSGQNFRVGCASFNDTRACVWPLTMARALARLV
jgi:hypothetical protein